MRNYLQPVDLIRDGYTLEYCSMDRLNLPSIEALKPHLPDIRLHYQINNPTDNELHCSDFPVVFINGVANYATLCLDDPNHYGYIRNGMSLLRGSYGGTIEVSALDFNFTDEQNISYNSFIVPISECTYRNDTIVLPNGYVGLPILFLAGRIMFNNELNITGKIAFGETIATATNRVINLTEQQIYQTKLWLLRNAQLRMCYNTSRIDLNLLKTDPILSCFTNNDNTSFVVFIDPRIKLEIQQSMYNLGVIGPVFKGDVGGLLIDSILREVHGCVRSRYQRIVDNVADNRWAMEKTCNHISPWHRLSVLREDGGQVNNANNITYSPEIISVYTGYLEDINTCISTALEMTKNEYSLIRFYVELDESNSYSESYSESISESLSESLSTSISDSSSTEPEIYETPNFLEVVNYPTSDTTDFNGIYVSTTNGTGGELIYSKVFDGSSNDGFNDYTITSSANMWYMGGYGGLTASGGVINSYGSTGSCSTLTYTPITPTVLAITSVSNITASNNVFYTSGAVCAVGVNIQPSNYQPTGYNYYIPSIPTDANLNPLVILASSSGNAVISFVSSCSVTVYASAIAPSVFWSPAIVGSQLLVYSSVLPATSNILYLQTPVNAISSFEYNSLTNTYMPTNSEAPNTGIFYQSSVTVSTGGILTYNSLDGYQVEPITEVIDGWFIGTISGYFKSGTSNSADALGNYSSYTNTYTESGGLVVNSYGNSANYTNVFSSTTSSADTLNVNSVTSSDLDNNTWTYAKSGATAATCTLPFTVNNVDTLTASYYRGTVDYALNINLTKSRNYYVQYQAANQRGIVTLNNISVGTITNAYQPKVVELPQPAIISGSNQLTTTLSNAEDSSNIPYKADFNFLNGLERGVLLLDVGRIYFDPINYGTKRCLLRFKSVNSNKYLSAKFGIQNRGNNTEQVKFEVKVYLNASNTPVASTLGSTYIDSDTTKAVSVDVLMETVQAWNGLNNVNIYRIVIELSYNSVVIDSIQDTTGYRTFSAAKYTTSNDGAGFMLNGVAYKLYGVNYHTDYPDKGGALSSDNYLNDFDLIVALKPTMIKFAHYPCDHSLLSLCDLSGIVVMLEIPWSRNFPSSSSGIAAEYRANITSAMLSMVKEYYNHPSVVFWCFDNELGYDSTLGYDVAELHTFMSNLYSQVKVLDPDRLVGAGFYKDYNTTTAPERKWTDVCDIMLSTHYKGWYGDTANNNLSDANTDNAQMVMPKAINEYGFGANPDSHIEWSLASTGKPASPNAASSIHYEEYQAYGFEQYFKSFKNVLWPVFNLQWSIFDFAVSSRNEGGVPYTNTKGLITRDRSTIKDAYYLFQASWNSTKLVHICQKKWMNRGTQSAALHVYSNCAVLKLYVNNVLQETLTTANGTVDVSWDFTATNFVNGENVFEVRGYNLITDTVAQATDSWTYIAGIVDSSDSISDSISASSSLSGSGSTSTSSGVNSVSLAGDSVAFDSTTLLATVDAEADISTAVNWSSSNESIATVINGLVTVISEGTVNIIATSAVDSTKAAVKTIKCYLDNAADNALQAFIPIFIKKLATPYTSNGVEISFNLDGTITLNGTVTYIQQPIFLIQTSSGMPTATIGFPMLGYLGDTIVAAKVISGSADSEFIIRFYHEDTTSSPDVNLSLAPISMIGSQTNINAAIQLQNTNGIHKIDIWTQNTNITFTNLVLRISTMKRAVLNTDNVYYDGGLIESALMPVNTYAASQKDSVQSGFLARAANGMFALALLQNVYKRVAVTGVSDGTLYTNNTESSVLAETVLIPSGKTVKLRIKLIHHDFNLASLTTSHEFKFLLRYASGSIACEIPVISKPTVNDAVINGDWVESEAVTLSENVKYFGFFKSDTLPVANGTLSSASLRFAVEVVEIL